METVGLYIHVPFCLSKCPYCDFYSLPLGEEDLLERHTTALVTAMEQWGARASLTADTLYFGGGTPSLLGGERLARIIRAADRCFSLFAAGIPEITLEANPADNLADTLAAFTAAGGNRLSLGMQSAVPEELRRLGRRHTPADVERTVADARRAGIRNLSLDMMLGISAQTADSVKETARCVAALGATHVSAYLLKREPHTPYGHRPPPLPNEDEAADLYLTAIDELEMLGYRQYEISNLARPGMESRHNRKYWDARPYLGLGPAAASYLNGRRFTYPRDLNAFLQGGEPTEETDGQIPAASPTEYALLRLRLTAGLDAREYETRFHAPLPTAWRRRAAALPVHLVTADEQGIRFTRQGFLLSNTLTRAILLKEI